MPPASSKNRSRTIVSWVGNTPSAACPAAGYSANCRATASPIPGREASHSLSRRSIPPRLPSAASGEGSAAHSPDRLGTPPPPQAGGGLGPPPPGRGGGVGGGGLSDVDASNASTSDRNRDTACDSSSERPGASPS